MQITTSILKDELLKNKTDLVIENNKLNFFGELDFYNLYLNKENYKYALIYGFYQESKYSILEISSFIEKDLFTLQSIIKEHSLILDYFFLMPYYEMDISKRTSLLLPPSTTKDIEILI